MFIYYVYAYLRKDHTPYYIGKGKKSRAFVKGKGEIIPPKDKSRIVFLETNLSEVGALALERRMIRWYGRKDLGTGILRNKTDGGDGIVYSSLSETTKKAISWENRKHSEETREKMSESHKGKQYRLGHKHSKEVLEKLSIARRKRVFSEETKKKLSEAAKKQYAEGRCRLKGAPSQF